MYLQNYTFFHSNAIISGNIYNFGPLFKIVSGNLSKTNGKIYKCGSDALPVNRLIALVTIKTISIKKSEE